MNPSSATFISVHESRNTDPKTNHRTWLKRHVLSKRVNKNPGKSKSLTNSDFYYPFVIIVVIVVIVFVFCSCWPFFFTKSNLILGSGELQRLLDPNRDAFFLRVVIEQKVVDVFPRVQPPKCPPDSFNLDPVVFLVGFGIIAGKFQPSSPRSPHPGGLIT